MISGVMWRHENVGKASASVRFCSSSRQEQHMPLVFGRNFYERERVDFISEGNALEAFQSCLVGSPKHRVALSEYILMTRLQVHLNKTKTHPNKICDITLQWKMKLSLKKTCCICEELWVHCKQKLLCPNKTSFHIVL